MHCEELEQAFDHAMHKEKPSETSKSNSMKCLARIQCKLQDLILSLTTQAKEDRYSG